VGGLVQLAPGRLATRLFRFAAPDLDVDGGWTSLPLRAVGTTPSGKATVTFVLSCPGRCVMDACEVAPGTVLSWRPGTTYHGISPAGYRWATVIVPEALVQDLAPVDATRGSDGLPLRRARMPAHVRADVLALQREMGAWRMPGSEPVPPEQAGRLRERWTDLLVWALRACQPVAGPSAGALHAAAVVRAAEAYLLRKIGDDVYLRDVSASIAVPGRTIEAAFRSVLGMPPMRYLEILRAHAVFLSLRSTGRDAPRTVREAERRAGVTHGARFAARYRSIFAENPADTFRAARGAARRPADESEPAAG
jgi:methylphosphotriester-DNA--protein-cysteine methyltransferase